MKRDDDELNKTYQNVPGHGQPLPDGTWWTNCEHNVGYVAETHHYDRKYEGGKHYSKPNRCRCVEVSTFDGKPFSRWEQLESEWREAILYDNNSMQYK